MFIKNSEIIEKKFKCNKTVYLYLREKLPLLSRDVEYYYFADTSKLREIISKAPCHIRLIVKFNRW